MKLKTLLLLACYLCFYSFNAGAQTGNSNVEIQDKNVKISATENINLTTGSGGVYHNNKAIATVDDISRSATLVVAASNASEKSKKGADFICTGENDHLVIQQALDLLREKGGAVCFTEGTFYLQSQVIPSGKIMIYGQGAATIFTGKTPYTDVHWGMIMCGDNLELTVRDMTFKGDGGSLKGITSLYGISNVGQNIKSIRLENLTFEDINEKAISIEQTNVIENVVVEGITLRNVLLIRFRSVKNLSINNILCGNGCLNVEAGVENAIVNKVFTTNKIQISNYAIISSCVCGYIQLQATSNNCIVFGNKAPQGITNLGINNRIFNNY